MYMLGWILFDRPFPAGCCQDCVDPSSSSSSSFFFFFFFVDLGNLLLMSTFSFSQSPLSNNVVMVDHVHHETTITFFPFIF